jgi:hypothetical protein
MASLQFHRGAARPARGRRFRQFEAVIEELLGNEDLGPVRVRFIPGSRRDDDGRFLCQVYAGPTGVFVGTPEWVWWSPPFTTSEELRGALVQALYLRRIGTLRRLAGS